MFLGIGGHAGGTLIPVRMKFNASSPLLEVYINGSSVYTGTGGGTYGGIAFGGDKPKFDNLKVGYDNNNDDDIDDAGDDVIINETFTSTSVAPGYDHAGNLIDDGNFQYIYDAWNRLVKVRASLDADVTVQTAEFFADAPELSKQAQTKTASPLFAVALRLAASAENDDRCWAIIRQVASGLGQFGTPTGNELIPRGGESYRFKKDETDEGARDDSSRKNNSRGPDLVPLTEPEVRRLLVNIVWPQLTNIERTLLWSTWRRRHQAIAKRCHYRTRTRKTDAQL